MKCIFEESKEIGMPEISELCGIIEEVSGCEFNPMLMTYSGMVSLLNPAYTWTVNTVKELVGHNEIFIYPKGFAVGLVQE